MGLAFSVRFEAGENSHEKSWPQKGRWYVVVARVWHVRLQNTVVQQAACIGEERGES